MNLQPGDLVRSYGEPQRTALLLSCDYDHTYRGLPFWRTRDPQNPRKPECLEAEVFMELLLCANCGYGYSAHQDKKCIYGPGTWEVDA